MLARFLCRITKSSRRTLSQTSSNSSPHAFRLKIKRMEFMPQYRVCFVERGRTTRPPAVIDCADHDLAKDKAKEFIGRFDIELWDGPRMVIWYPRK